MEAPEAYLDHTVPGRTRWRIPSKKGDRTYFKDAAERLSSLPDVVWAEGHPLTGSLVVRHRGAAGGLASKARSEGLFAQTDAGTGEPARPQASLADDIGGRLDQFDDWISRHSGRRLDLPSVIFLAFAGSAVVQLVRGRVAAPAATLGWYALNSFLLARTASTHRLFEESLNNGGSDQT